jgi:4-amino-4-deoxy-L-arabinose transferase-like glycosyltransferase
MGLAIFSKAVIAFPIFGAAIGLLLVRSGLKRAVRNPQVWVIGVLAVLPYITYYLYGEFVAGYSTGSLGGRFFADALITPSFYLRWGIKASTVVNPIFLAFALAGLFLLRSRENRWFMLGLWMGYITYGLVFNYQTSTHDYYHLPLIPIVALSLSPLVMWLTMQAESFISKPTILRWVFLGVLALAICLSVWRVHRILAQADYRGAGLLYENIGQKIGRKRKAIALTDDYGNRLAYWGWISPRIWPSFGDLNYQRKVSGKTSEFRKLFSSLTRGMDYFVVTRFDELELQPELKDFLSQNYQVHDWGDGFVIFDLGNPLAEPIEQ